jgi:outer membrane usher protein
VTVTNALGKQVVSDVPIYASSVLLASGLQTFSPQMGAARRNWGLLIDNYGNPAAGATYCRGVSSEVTVEASAQGTMGTFMTGGGIVIRQHNHLPWSATRTARSWTHIL